MPGLCIVTQYYPPEMGAPQARLSELASRLAATGWRVEILTALPNYPTGAVFPGYRRHKPVVEELGGLRVARVPLFTAKTGFARRIASYMSYATAAAALGPHLLSRPDLLWVESPPLFIAPAAWGLALRWRCRYVLNVSDLWPESAIRMGIIAPGAASHAAEKLEVALYRRSAGVTGQSSEIIQHVAARAPGVPTCEITNGVDPARYGRSKADAAARELIGSEPGPVFVYAGLLGWAQGLDQILDLARDWPSQSPGRFVLVGEGPEKERLAARIAGEKLTRVKLLPAVPRERVPPLLAAADVAIITLGMSIPGAVPSKIYEAMASNLPILLVADGEPAARVDGAGAGLCVRPGDSAGLATAALRLAEDADLRDRLAAGGRQAAETP
jgi:glycosyltransferase involved in cell wall biosynthesis